MAKTILAGIRAIAGATPTRLQPPQDAHGGVLRRIWPYVRLGYYGVLLSVAIGGKLLVSARLIKFEDAAWTLVYVIAVCLILAIAEEILERLNWIDKTKPPKPLEEDIPTIRPPPPITDEAPNFAHPTPVRHPVGGTIPAERCGCGRAAEWRLEDDYQWRREDGEPSR